MRVFLLMVFVAATGCQATQQPAFVEVLEVVGDDYERGFQHGQRFSSKIRSLYTTLLVNSLLPAITRERPDIASILLEYDDDRYLNGRFAEEVMLESAYSLEESIPEAYLAEMHGIADGAGLPYDQVLVLNTFIDTVLAVRTLQKFMGQAQAPHLVWFEVDGLGTDGLDNDGDGEIDERGEGRVEPYDPLLHATFVGVPTRPTVRFLLEDRDGVDPATIRVQIEDEHYAQGDPEVTMTVGGVDGELLEIVITPRVDFPVASVVGLRIEGGDLSLVTDPPPAHARFMRDQAMVLGTVGLDRSPREIVNRALPDDRFPPPSIAFAVRGSATPDGAVRVAHHFALLDAGTSHKHGVILVHRPDDGIDHLTVGLAGVVWGTSGMNADGVVWTVNLSDTLDNPITDEVRRNLFAGRLISSGVPFGIMGREVLRWSQSAGEARAYLEAAAPTNGWNHLVADATGEMSVIEMDSNILEDPSGGKFAYGPDAVDADGRPFASSTPDDLRMATHYLVNREDIRYGLLGFELLPQRFWSGQFHRSVRAFDHLGRALAERHGHLDTEGVISLMREPELVDTRDSMNAVVYEPGSRTVRYALGTVPATDSPFLTLQLGSGP